MILCTFSSICLAKLQAFANPILWCEILDLYAQNIFESYHPCLSVHSFQMHHTFPKWWGLGIFHATLANTSNLRRWGNILSRPQHWQEGAGKSTFKVFLQLVHAKCCCPHNEINSYESKWFYFCKWSTILDIFLNAFCNVRRDHILVHTLKVILAYLW